MSYDTKELEIYTCRKVVYERLKSKLGEPTKIFYTKRKISGARWNIPFKDKKRINIALSRPVIIGEVE